MNHKSHRWHKTAIAAAAATLFGLLAAPVMALSLGSITVQSALGEPLRAEIDVPDINAEESSSLKASVASPETFRAAGLDYNAAMSSLRASLQRRPDGRAYIRLTSERPINEPFVDMIIEASWASGRIVRDFTMLFDPPHLRVPVAPGATLPQVVAAPSGAGAAPMPSGPLAATPSRPAVAQAPATTRPATAPRKPANVSNVAPKASAPERDLVSDKQIKVKPGDTASRIAATVKPANVSLDQMLVALLRANPDAFINNNINRIKSGALINVPTAEQAQATGTTEATRMVIAQSRDFNDFRKKLAGSAPSTQMAAADRQSSGSVQARVDDRKPGTAAPDKLTLSKGAVQAQADTDRIAKERAAKDASGKAAELSKNISDLGKIGAASSPAVSVAMASASAPSVAAPVVPVAPIAPIAPIMPAASATPIAPIAPAISAAASADNPVAAPVAAVSTPIAPDPMSAPAPAMRPVTPIPASDPGLIDQLLENPLVPAGTVGLIALLAGFGFYRARQRRKAMQEDSAFLESRLQPDSFFGASGGHRIDTNDGAQTGSSMVYSPSQLDAADDVDPVAEADVYLAYGRDLQAEEILKEALKANPGRIAIHQKLLEIYAKRRDVKSFESLADDAHTVTDGSGPEWQRVCELGLGIDPTNPLYQPGGAPVTGGLPAQPVPLEVASGFASTTVPLGLQPHSAPSTDLDLDLDFSLDEENASIMSELGSRERTAGIDAVRSDADSLDMDFDTITQGYVAPGPQGGIAAGNDSVKFELPDLDHPNIAHRPSTGESEDFRHQAAVSFGSTAPVPLLSETVKPPALVLQDSGMLEFDLGSLSLDLSDSTEGSSLAANAPAEDPLATKLALAEEFSAIGDDDGARALIEEVISEASGPMKTRAQKALTMLS